MAQVIIPNTWNEDVLRAWWSSEQIKRDKYKLTEDQIATLIENCRTQVQRIREPE